MKKAKKILCTLLVVVMCVMSVPMEGVKEIDFSRLDFGIRASAESGGKANSVDYSNLTANQYMAKVLLNSNYVGAANSYGERSTTIPESQYSFYINPNNISFTRILCSELEKSDSFMQSVAAWKVLTFDPSEAYEDYLDEKNYYIAILYSLIDAEIKDSQFLSALNCSTNETILSLSNTVADIMEKSYSIDVTKLAKVDISNLTESQMNDLLNQIGDAKEAKSFYKFLGDDIGTIKLICNSCKTVYDVVKSISMYSDLVSVSETISDVLYEIYKNVPLTNDIMKQAAKEVYETCNEQLSQTIFTMTKAGNAIFNAAFSTIVSTAWKTCLGSVGSTIAFGRAIGKTISNFCFSTDAIIEQYQALTYVRGFEDVIVKTVKNLAGNFKNNESEENADLFLKAFEMLLSIYTLGCDYSYDFANIAKNKGLVNNVKSLFGHDDTVESYRKSVNSMKNSIDITKIFLISMDGYRWYYEDDAPSAYKALFEPDSKTNSSSVSAAYSKNSTPLYMQPTPQGNADSHAILTYKHESDNTLTVTSCNPNAIGSVVIPKDVGGVAIRKIANNAFAGCDKITEITTNSTLRNIGSRAFSGCTGLTNITFPSSLTNIGYSAFSGCSKLSKITLNDGLKTIGYHAFYGTALTSVTIPKTVTTMGDSSDSPFEGIDTLKTVIFSYGMLKIPVNALRDVTSVTSVSLPNGITEIGNYAFRGCTGLTNITFPSSLTNIGYSAFSGCTGLTNITFPSSLTNIGYSAFSGCSKLSKITLNDGLKTIGYHAFYGTALTSVTIPKTVTTMGDSSDSPFEGIDTLKTVIFSYGMLKIPVNALRNVTSVTSVSLPNGITEIGNYAFSGCTGLTTLYLPITIEKINNSAFYNCTNIASVNYIGNQEKWNQISIGSNNEPITNATIKYNYNHSTHTYYPSITKDALCLETGVMTYSCFCGASYTSTIPAKGHQMGEYALVKAATCKEKGEERSYCELCGTFVSREIDYAAHTDGNKDKICDLCGEPSTSIIDCGVFGEDYEDYENLTWTLYTDGELIISGTGRMNSKYIPWSSYCEKITSLVICEGVTNIVSSAFADCEHLSEVSLPTTLTEIGDFAFLNTEIMNNANNYIDNVLYVDDYLITVLDDDNADIVDFTIKPGTRVVADFAFSDVSYNFKGTFTIPESVINLGDNLKYLRTVSKFNVDNSNKYYSNDSNGILYNKDKTVLVRCPEETFDSDNVLKNSKFKIPNTVIEIANDACSSCKFSEVAIPESVIKIGDRAFSSSNIKSFTIGNSIESMGLSVFGHTPWFAAQPYGEIYAGNVFCDYKIKNHNITEINIKPGTTVIAEGALGYQPYDYLKVEELILPEGIKIIGEGAFSSLRDLKKVSIPSTIEKVYGFNFEYCKKLEVNYNGTSESWSKVSIDFRNYKLINATINFIDDAPSHTHSPKAITIPASCTVDGMTYQVCSVCGEPIGTSTIIPAAHTPGDWEITIEATYEAEGKRVKKCTVCHEVIESEVIPKLVNTTITDEKTGIEIKYTGNKYDGDVGITVTETFDGSAFQLINTVGATSSKVYDITLTVDGESIQPKGKVTVKIPLPSGYNPNQSYVYHVNTNTGAVEKMPARYENGYMVFETDHFSYYAVIEIHEHTFSGSVCSTCGYDRSTECTCNCHKGGISGFFFKLINFFQKLFGNNKVCACGKVH